MIWQIGLVNSKQMTQDAYENHYAIAHFNVNTLEWVRAIIQEAMASRAPVIIATSQRILHELGGIKTAANWIKNFIEFYQVDIPIALHLDHANYETCLEALEHGYTSIMYDGSKESFQENLKKAQKLALESAKHHASLEAEIGSIGGVEDGQVGNIKFATPQEALLMQDAQVDLLAIGIGNIHGPYPPSWKTLSFETLVEMQKVTKIPLVLHGSSGIPEEQLLKSISLGISKVNYNTELQQAFARGLINFVESKKVYQKKNYDPYIFCREGEKEMRKAIKEIFIKLGSYNKIPS